MGNCLVRSSRPAPSLEYEDSFIVGAGGAALPAEAEPRVWDAVSERLPAAAAQGSRSVVDLIGGPGYLDVDVWTANLDVPVIKARATALENGVDAMLVPLLKGTEAQIAGSLHLSWDQLDIVGLLGCMAAAARDNVPLDVVAEAVQRLLRLMLAISKSADANKLPAPQAVFQVASINRLIRIISIIATRDINPDTRERAMVRWAQWKQLTTAIGLTEDGMALVLDATSRSLLIFMHVPARAGGCHAILPVRRGSCFQDGCLQAQTKGLLDSAPPTCLLSPTFTDAAYQGDVELESGHGPRREFFRLSGQGMLAHPGSASSNGSNGSGHLESGLLPPLFVHVPSANKLWFNTRLVDTPRLKEAYAYAGWLTAQQLANCASLNVALPELVFEKLLEGERFKASIERLQEFDAAAAAGLRIVAAAGQMSDADFKDLLEVEGCPHSMSRQTYVQRAVHHHLVGSIEWQSAAFAQGFFKALPMAVLQHWRVTPTDLADITQGGHTRPSANFGFRRVFRCCVQPDVPPALGNALLEILDGMAPAGKRAVLAFATSAGRPPPRETEVLRVGLASSPAEHSHPDGILGRLPQAHTCENLLELPDYYSALVSQQATNRRLSIGSRGGRLSHIISAVSPKSSPKEGGSKTPRTPKSPGGGRAARELDKRLREVLSERLAFAVAECHTYHMPTRHAIAHTVAPPLPAAAPEAAEAAVAQNGTMTEEDSSLRWQGASKSPAPADTYDDSSSSSDQGRGGNSTSSTSVHSRGRRGTGPSRLATASFPGPQNGKAASPRSKGQSPRKAAKTAHSKKEGLPNGKTRIGMLADSSSRQAAEAEEAAAAAASDVQKEKRPGKGPHAHGSEIPSPDSPLDRGLSIAAVHH